VGADALGKAVRCPHCQQVIQAPAAAPALAPAGAAGSIPEFKVPSRTEEEGSIFNEAEEDGDDLFNQGKAATVEIPPGPSPHAIVPTMPPPPALAPTPASLAALPANGSGVTVKTSPGEQDAMASARELARARSQKENKITLWLLILLVPYALIMTVAVILLVLFRPQPKNEFPDIIPDAPRDTSSTYQRADDARPLPDNLKVGLGATLRVGDLEVTPEKVAWQRIFYSFENTTFNPEPSPSPALVITLKLKNVSDKYAFVPNDLFFNRKSGGSSKPYNCVVYGPTIEDRIYGGPCSYKPKVTGRSFKRQQDAREYIKGYEYTRMLKPGETMTMIVCTNPEDNTVPNKVNAAKDLQWRIQLRRGVIVDRDREGTATSVIGVNFATADIKTEG
jgi:hypothetical protein